MKCSSFSLIHWKFSVSILWYIKHLKTGTLGPEHKMSHHACTPVVTDAMLKQCDTLIKQITKCQNHCQQEISTKLSLDDSFTLPFPIRPQIWGNKRWPMSTMVDDKKHYCRRLMIRGICSDVCFEAEASPGGSIEAAKVLPQPYLNVLIHRLGLNIMLIMLRAYSMYRPKYV